MKEHEDGHKDIAEKSANDLDKSLPGTQATGTGKNFTAAKNDAASKLREKVADKHDATVKDQQAKSDKYDQKTEHGAHQERWKLPQ